MAIPAHYIQELLQRNNVYDVISSHVQLKRHGRIYKGLCPFHSEKTPSFTVYPDTQSYYCFGCGAGGDIISFTKEINGLTYVEAVKALAQQSGMPLPDEDDKVSRLKGRIYEMNKIAARYFHANLNSEKGKNARIYLRQRQLSDKTIVNFGLGYATDDWQGLCNHLKSKGYSEDEMVSAYLAARSSKGNVYDIFRDRIIFPIIDLRGNVIAFGGRRMGDEGGPKYLNSGDTPVFKKSNGLFAMNIAKKSGKETFILAEGYMDVISLHQAGFNNALATLGTALTSQQAKLIADYAKNVVIAYDSDEAGQKATRRAMDIFSKEDVSVKVLQMDGAKDPDEYIKKYGKERFEMLIDGANSALDFEILKLRKQHDIKDTQGRIDYLTKVCDLLAKIPSPILQDVYCSRLSNETGADKASIKLQLEQSKSRLYRSNNAKRSRELLKEGIAGGIKVDYRQQGNTLPKVFAQQQIISALIRDNELFTLVDSQLTEDDFTDVNMKNAFVEYKKLKAEGQEVSYALLCHYLEQETRQILAKINADNADIIITADDVRMHIDNLKSAPKGQTEIKNTSREDLAKWVESLKEKKK
ncbi:MAG: DNA primase [Oscillospiraceae bacterium]|nr:DNA primase [Oscillospiraceae bacterium]